MTLFVIFNLTFFNIDSSKSELVLQKGLEWTTSDVGGLGLRVPTWNRLCFPKITSRTPSSQGLGSYGSSKWKKKLFLRRYGRVVWARKLKIYVKTRRDGTQVVLKFGENILINMEAIRENPSFILKWNMR